MNNRAAILSCVKSRPRDIIISSWNNPNIHGNAKIRTKARFLLFDISTSLLTLHDLPCESESVRWPGRQQFSIDYDATLDSNHRATSNRDSSTPIETSVLFQILSARMIDVQNAAVLWPLLLVIAIVAARRYRKFKRVETSPTPKAYLQVDQSNPVQISVLKGYIDAFPDLGNLNIPKGVEAKEQMIKDKELYWKLQNIEDHPGEWPVPPGHADFSQKLTSPLEIDWLSCSMTHCRPHPTGTPIQSSLSPNTLRPPFKTCSVPLTSSVPTGINNIWQEGSLGAHESCFQH